MKLSNDTREVLKNFSTINQNLLVKNGTAIGTMSAMKNIVAKATVPDTFNNEFAIYDLNEFLSAMSLFKDPTLAFDEKSVCLNEEGGGSNLTYMFSDPSIVTAPKTDINMPFVLNLKGGELELVAKTVMRKKNFRTSGPKMSFEDVRKMPDGKYGVYADKFVKGKRVMTPGGKHAKELKKVYSNEKDANDYMAAIMIAKGG